MDEINKEGKLRDFMDRIDAIIPIPPTKKELLSDNWKTEYEELASMLILKHFPTVKFVGKLALEVIAKSLIDESSVRTAEKIVFNSRPEDEELFDLSCLPKKQQMLQANKSDQLVDGREKAVWEIIVEKPVKAAESI